MTKYQNMKRKNAKKYSQLIKVAVMALLWLIVLGIIGFLAAFAYFAPQIPDPQTIITRRVNEGTKILDRKGETVLFNVHGDERRTIIPFDQMPENLKEAAIAAEDGNFYAHQGLDIKGVVRAIFVNIKDRGLSQGGSTITQQLVKNSLLGRQKTFSRKFKETILALQIERRFEKDQILWMYLNQVSFGSNIFGAEEASQGYFGKLAKNLTLNESAILASLIKAPSFYSPYGSHKEEMLERKNLILDRMLESGLVSEAEFNQAKNEETKLASPFNGGILAPHFVMMIREYLVEKYGEDLIQNGGLKVYTTLNWEMQQKAEEIIQKYADRNEQNFRAGNAALVTLDPRTGEILALVGSRNYFDIEKDGNFNVVTAFRQPGSAFKPIVYSMALDKGLTDKTILFDAKTEFNPFCPPEGNQEKDQYELECYHPQNSDEKFRGPVTLRQALGSSLNIPSVKILYLAGVNESIERANDLGINFLGDSNNFGLSLVLGGGDVRPLDLVSAYGVFANDGIYNQSSFILKVEDAEGKIIEEFDLDPQRKVAEQTARTINDILSDNSARGLLFGLNSLLNISDRPVAVKTGTTQKFRDAWTIGYTPSIVTGVWVGNNDNTEMTAEGGGISAGAPIWREFILEILKDESVEEFQKPDPVFIDKIMLNGSYVDENGETHTILHYLDKADPRGPVPSNPSNDPQYNNWEWAVKNYQ
ncbi:MAG: 1A family penicillin-binding protein [Parcubacteria group bacterium Gr01-1014_2]|nr:MAG: 1A family penicillin-binding protein [Parcubacteria group bacterium Gr01-1014_2]